MDAIRIFLLGFFWAALTSASFYFFIPILFPEWNIIYGLVSPDSQVFHRIAWDLSRNIHSDGWQAWSLKPEGQAPAGIAAAIYYLTIPKPWVLIPLNAAVHGASALFLFLIVRSISGNERASFLAVIPFLFFLSAMNWYAQLHKDGAFILGNLLFLYGWVYIASQWKNPVWKQVVVALLSVALGVHLIGIFRPYFVEVILFFSLLALLIIALFGFFAASGWRQRWLALVLPLGIYLVTTVTASSYLSLENVLWQGEVSSQSTDLVSDTVPSSDVVGGMESSDVVGGMESSDVVGGMESSDVVGGMESSDVVEAFRWRRSYWLPEILDSKLERLARARRGFLAVDGNSNLDTNINFESAEDLLRYLPRAFSIAFFSPFPKDWVENGSLPENTIMRRIVGFEMLIVYVALFGGLLGLYIWRARLEVWLVSIFATGGALIYSFTVPNMGTLYRMRYAFLMLLVSLGVAALWVFFLSRYKSNRFSG